MKRPLQRFAFGCLSASAAAGLSITTTTFHVVGFPEDGQKFALKIFDTLVPMMLGEDQTVWSGAVQASPGDAYSYVVVDESSNVEVAGEPFARTLQPTWVERTPNEMFNRSATTAVIPALPQTYAAWPYGYTEVFNSSYVPTVHVISPDFGFDDVYSAASDGASVTMVMVTQYTVYKREDVTLSLGGNSNSEYRKRQLKLKMSGDDNIDGRQVFKFRTGARDPSFLREKTYMDIANSVGLPTQQGTHARVFVNKRFFGTYLMEDLMGNTWAKVVLTGGNETANAMLTDSGYGFDFVYRGDDLDAYEEKGYHVVTKGPEGTNPIEILIPVIKKISEFDPTNATNDEVEELKKLINFDLVYRHACVEYLAIHWDGSWNSASNLFFTFANGKWFFAPTDFDMTLGCVISASRGGLTAPYTNWTRPKDPESADGKSYTGRPLFDNTLPHPTFKGMFEQTCKNIVQTVFHPAALRPRLKALHDFLRDDVAADRDPAVFTPPSGGGGLGDYHWTVGHFDYGYGDGDWETHGLSCEFDCEMPGILKFVGLRAPFLASQIGFTFEDSYVAPAASSLYGGKAAANTTGENAASATTSAVQAALEQSKGLAGSGDRRTTAISTWVSAVAVALGAIVFMLS